MPQKTGTYGVADLLAAKNLSVVKFGLSTVVEVLAADNANFTKQMESALADFAQTSSDRQRINGSSVGGNMMEVDEYGQGPTQKDVPSYFLGFPLKKFQFPIGWTMQWEKNATVADFAIKNAAAQGADWRRTRYELQKAVFTPTNTTYKDHLVDNAPLPVKAFINADSSPVPNGPNGETFNGATHTHYNGIAALTAASLTALIQTLAEHRNGATIRLNFNVADVATVTALTGFIPLQVPYVSIGTYANQVTTPRLEILRVDDRQIGFFGSAEVWTKPWAVANYAVAVDVAAPQKPLVRRVEENDRGLYIAAEVDTHPLRAQYVEHFFGFGAWNRLAVAVLQFNNASYSIPILTY
jgi:hypothetical protein